MKFNNVEHTKLVVIRGSGNIPELGNICAPVLTPQRVAISKLAKIISSGLVVMEVNPKNKDERVRLTISNLRNDNFPEAPAAKAVEEKAEQPAPAKAEVKPAVPAKKEEKKVEAAPAKAEAKPEVKVEAKPTSDFTAK